MLPTKINQFSFCFHFRKMNPLGQAWSRCLEREPHAHPAQSWWGVNWCTEAAQPRWPLSLPCQGLVVLAKPLQLPRQLRTDSRTWLRNLFSLLQTQPAAAELSQGWGDLILIFSCPSAPLQQLVRAAGPPRPVSHDTAPLSPGTAFPAHPSAVPPAPRTTSLCYRRDPCCKEARKIFPQTKRLHEPPAFHSSRSGELCWA